MNRTPWMGVFAALALLNAPACAPPPANAAVASPKPFVARDVSPPAAADSFTYIVKWGAVSDGNGPATSYVDTVRAGSAVVHTKATAALADTFRVAAPAIGTSTTFTACVRAVRRGLSSATGCVMWTASTADVPPPAPAPVVDSSQIKAVATFLTSPGVVGSNLLIAAGDSAMLTMHVVRASGDTTLASRGMTWSSSDTTEALIHALPGTASAWIVVPITAASRLQRTGGVFTVALR